MDAPHYVAVLLDGQLTIHMDAPAAGGYDTACGIDANDAAIGHQPAEVPPGAKIDCEACRQLWALAGRYGVRDFRP